jgi:hypothetical protein
MSAACVLSRETPLTVRQQGQAVVHLVETRELQDYVGQWPLEEPVLQDIIERVQQVTLTSSKHD